MTASLDHKGRHIHVPGRADVGTVIQWGKSLGAPSHNVFAVMIYFEKTGEVSYDDHKKVEFVDDRSR